MSEDSVAESKGSAEQLFNQFCDSNDFREILYLFTSLCSQLGIDHNQYDGFYLYPTLKSSLTSWKAASLFQLLDARVSLPEYKGQRACAGKRVLVVGAGPVGLRGAIELALLGARVDLVEKRPDFQRNNSLHLWPFLITDLRNLGAKKFYGRFASGSIDHICIRILQAILLKVCLILGVKVYAGVTFNRIIEPTKNNGWRIEATPTNTPVSSYNYNVVFAADGKKDSLPGFRIKEFRAKLALAITVNFVNHNTKQENSVPEIGGVAFVYRQDFFNSLAQTHGIELENIVYYKDETHYFVMTVRKQSLLRKGVLKKDSNDPKQLLSSANIDRTSLEKFALEATTFATEGGLGEVEFEINHRGEKDVALFDFTSLFAAENAARIIERKGQRLLMCLAGDSLINPFWPTGSGCARGFLGAFDDAWMIRRFCSEDTSPLELIEERESILYLLPQTTPHRLNRNFAAYTIDPKTRYLNLSELVLPGDVSHLYDTDNQNAVAVAKARSTVQASTQDKPKAAVEEKTVTIKRSKSSEVLYKEAPSATPTSTPSHHPTPTPSQPQGDVTEPFTSNVKSALKRFSMKDSSAEQGKSKPSLKETQSNVANKQSTKPTKDHRKDTKITSKDTKQPSKDTKGTPKETKRASKGTKGAPKDSAQSPKQEGRAAPGPAKDSLPSTHHSKPSLSPTLKGRQSPVPLPTSSPTGKVSPVPQQKDSAHKVTNSKRPPSGKGSPKASPKISKKEQAVSASEKPLKKEPGSPKLSLSKFFSSSKPRARSESPEPSPKHSKKSSTKDLKKHSLQVSTSLHSLDKEPVSGTREDPQVNVLDIVKKYDLRAENLTRSEIKVGSGQQSGGQATVRPKEEFGAKGKSKQTDSPKSKKSKDGKKSKEDKKSSKEGKGGGKGSGLFSFFKSRKTYNIAEATKESDEKTKSPDQSLKEPGEQTSVQRRINQFKQMEMTDGEDTDVVLVSVSSLVEEGKNEEMLPEKLSESEEEKSPTQTESEEISDHSEENRSSSHTPTEEGTSPSQEGNSPPVEGREGDTEEAGADVGAELGEDGRSVRVKQLRQVFSFDHQPVSRHLSYSVKRSKEIDLSDVLSQQSKPRISDPLWLARVTQGLSKCLERLRKNRDIVVVKTALEIINTVLSNVQAHPDCDTYRQVRVSSKSFSEKVWQLPEASQFLSRAGWVEIDEFIVLPVEARVDNAKRVLDKHLNIVNQMLWSRQLELPYPSSGGVVRRPSKERKRVAILTRRDSYATTLVDESLQRIEEDTPILPPTTQRLPGGTAEDGSQTAEEPDHPAVSGEEGQTMRAASAARSVWRHVQWSAGQGPPLGSVREEKQPLNLISETELYFLPQSKVVTPPTNGQVPTEERTDGPVDQSNDVISHRLRKLNQKTSASSLQGGGGLLKERPGDQEDSPQPAVSPVSNSPDPPVEPVGMLRQAPGLVNERGESPLGQTDDVVADRLRKLGQSLSKKTSANTSTNKGVGGHGNVGVVSPDSGTTREKTVSEEPSDTKRANSPTASDSQPSTEEGSRSDTVSPQISTSLRDTSPSPENSTLLSPSNSGRGDQLRQLLGTRPKSPSSQETIKNKTEDQPKPTTDAQHSTEHSIWNERKQYGNLTMEVAAQTREKWKQTEEETPKTVSDGKESTTL